MNLSQIHHLEQYTGAWAMLPEAFDRIQAQIEAMDLAAHVLSAGGGDGEDRKIPRASAIMSPDGIAIVELVGTMTKYGSSMSSAPASVDLQRLTRQLARDPQVKGVLYVIDSPGGTVAGSYDLADSVAALNSAKPTAAWITDMGASGGYLIASQTGRITGNRMAHVGSIGTFTVAVDSSAQAKTNGLKVRVIRSTGSEMKGAGYPGTELTEEQIADIQRVIDQSNEQFVQSVARGRRISVEAARALAEGRVHVGAAAVANGLMDGIENFDQAMNQLVSRTKQTPPGNQESAARSKTAITLQETPIMSAPETPNTPAPGNAPVTPAPAPVVASAQPATLAQLKAALPRSTADFRESCLEKGLTLEQAAVAHANAAHWELEKRPSGLKKPMPSGLSNKSLRIAADTGEDPIAAFNEAVKDATTGGRSKAQAIAHVVHEQPDLHAAYVRAVNEPKRRPIPERFAV